MQTNGNATMITNDKECKKLVYVTETDTTWELSKKNSRRGTCIMCSDVSSFVTLLGVPRVMRK